VNELFGLSMTTIMLWLVGMLAVCLLAIGVIVLTNPTMVKLGLRNIPRRKAQSVLVVLGLMLATLIITAAFTTGDSIDHSITRDIYQILGPIDQVIEIQGSGTDAQSGQPYVDAAVVTNLEQRFQDNPDIRGFIAAIQEPVPVFNPATLQSGPQMMLTGVDPERIERLGGLRFDDGRPLDLAALPSDSVLLNPKSASVLQAGPGDQIQILVGNQPVEFTVAGIARPELLTGWVNTGPGTRDNGGVTMTLAAAQRLLDRPGQVNFIAIANTGGNRDGVERTDAVIDAVQPVLGDQTELAALGFSDVFVEVQPSKQDGLATAILVGNVFTTVFIVLGLFSIAAGVLLIFMIFVMLATERKAEMGMARAVGLKRRHLIQSFASEGMAYNLAAGLVGAALGVLAAWALVWVSGRLFGDSFAMDLRVTPRSLVVSYALGAVLTFITVVVSAWRVSKLNIVAAIRDIQEGRAKRAGRGSLIWGVIGTLIGVLFLLLGQSAGSAFPFSIGIMLVLLGPALILRFFGLSARLVFSVAGALIFIYWSLPVQWSDALFGELSGDIEMFFLSGVGMVVGSTLVLVYNAGALTSLFQGGHGRGIWIVPLVLGVVTAGLAVLGVVLRDQGQGLSQLLYMAAGLTGLIFVVSLFASTAERFRPALKMAIAYPLANRFRTGMTIAMFSLIVFSITVMSIITQSFADLFVTDTARAGWDLTAIVNRNNPLPDFRGALVESGFSHPDDVTAIGRTTFPTGQQEARLAGSDDWRDYPVIAADAGYADNIAAKFIARARGYESDEAVWQALQTEPGVAVIDGFSLQGGFGADPSMFRLAGEIKRDDMAFEPVSVELHDPISDRTTTVRIIGVVNDQVSQSVLWGIYVSPATYQTVFGQPQMNRVFMALAPGVDAETTNREIKAALVMQGVESFDLQTELEEQQRLQLGFNYIFQGFMALGLFVGVAALGVLAFRAVVERRQQIGMLRALGYQRGTVALSFILESSFISILGVLAGLVGATILGRNLFFSDAITETGSIDFQIPWLIVAGFVVVGFGFALLMTWWPAQRAASVPIAEALRYE
jgi:putative ABC transport system permease protein